MQRRGIPYVIPLTRTIFSEISCGELGVRSQPGEDCVCEKSKSEYEGEILGKNERQRQKSAYYGILRGSSMPVDSFKRMTA